MGILKMDKSIISGLKKGWTSLRTFSAGWLRSIADALETRADIWLWVVVLVPVIVVIGVLVWIF